MQGLRCGCPAFRKGENRTATHHRPRAGARRAAVGREGEPVLGRLRGGAAGGGRRHESMAALATCGAQFVSATWDRFASSLSAIPPAIKSGQVIKMLYACHLL